MKVLVINPGATSTKIAVFEEATEEFALTVDHTNEELAPFEGKSILSQLDFRRELILNTVKERGYDVKDFNAVCGRGGLLRHLPSGTYEVTQKVVDDLQDPPFGDHASNLGAVLAKQIADTVGVKAYFVDPVSVDEFEPVARITGRKGMERESFSHALNQKGMARKAAIELGKAYEDCNLVVVHMGGGVSVGAHHKGRMVDVHSVKEEGAFSMDRGGGLPVNAVINMCFSGMSKAEVKRELGSYSGVFSYLGTRDFREVTSRAFSGKDDEAKLIFDAFVYQIAKDVGVMGSVLKFEIDAIVLTGGIAYSKEFCAALEERVGKLAPFIHLPGEAEMESLALGALRVLHGEKASEY